MLTTVILDKRERCSRDQIQSLQPGEPLGNIVAVTVFRSPFFGVRYPLRMLSPLMFEFTWKLIWVLAAWLPPHLGHTLDPKTAAAFWNIFPVIVIAPLVLPWGYLWKTYATTPGDRWR